MKNDITLSNILKIYEKEISKNVKNKNKVVNFEKNKMQNISNILKMLLNGEVGHKHYNIFLIYEPKCRLVMSLPIKDKIINHFITRFCLEKKLSKYLDLRNCATRKNMGTDYALRLLKKYLEIIKRKYNKFYVLKIDISKYFYNIDHKVLKNLLIDKLNSFEYNIICKILDSTNNSYINQVIEKLEKNNNISIPHYKFDKGLPIGNMTSQFLSIFYLYKLDHYIVHNLGLKYYVRYMDDFIIISHDLEKLKVAKKIIREKLINEYKLKLNDKKTMITNSKNGFSFLGYTFKIIDKKTIIKIKQSNLQKVKRRIKKVKYDLNHNVIDYNKAFCSVMTYSYCYKYSSNVKVLNIINRYFYNEK